MKIVEWMVQEVADVFSGINCRPGVCGVEPCIVWARIPVLVLERARRMGASKHFWLHTLLSERKIW
jgi:uncharacterized protein (DUF433 family)